MRIIIMSFNQEIDPFLEFKSPSQIKTKGRPPLVPKIKKESSTEAELGESSTHRDLSRFEQWNGRTSGVDRGGRVRRANRGGQVSRTAGGGRVGRAGRVGRGRGKRNGSVTPDGIRDEEAGS